MNFSHEAFIESVGRCEFEKLQDILRVEHTVVRIGYYSGFLIAAVNAVIFLMACTLYWKTKRPSFIFIANLNISDTVLPLVASITTKYLLQTFLEFNNLYSTEVGGFTTHRDRVLKCRTIQSAFIVIMGNALVSLVLLTVDRYISIKFPLRYPVIIRKFWWMIFFSWIFFLTIASTVYASLNLSKNHVCTFVFTLNREYQAVVLLLVYSVIISVFVIYHKILRAHYNRKLQHSSLNNPQSPVPLKYSGRRVYVIPIDPIDAVASDNTNVKLCSIKSLDERGKITMLKSQINKKKRTISKSISFHLKYVQSSKYILVILIAFCIFHAPFYTYSTIELFRLYSGHYDNLHLHECRRNNQTLEGYHWSQDQDFYLGDCLRLLASEQDSHFVCSLPNGVDVTSSQFCHIIHQVSTGMDCHIICSLVQEMHLNPTN